MINDRDKLSDAIIINMNVRNLELIDEINNLEAQIRKYQRHERYLALDRQKIKEENGKLIMKHLENRCELIKANQLIKVQEQHIDDLYNDRNLLFQLPDTKDCSLLEKLLVMDNLKG